MRKIQPFVLLFAAALILAVSCSDDPQSPARQETVKRDDVIETILYCYDNPRSGESISRYNALLHSGYFFRLQDRDVSPGSSPILTRAQDIQVTGRIFEFQTMLELTITPEVGSWFEYPELEGAPCENCYATERQYFIRAQFSDEGTIYQSPVGQAFVSIIVAPDESDPDRWVIRAIYDIGR